MPTWKDNRRNGAALNKPMTTRYPASAVLMELASHVKAKALKVQAEWTPRSGNQETDELAKGNSERFSPTTSGSYTRRVGLANPPGGVTIGTRSRGDVRRSQEERSPTEQRT